ncbi:dihydrofolate reductase [Priestia endophytica]
MTITLIAAMSEANQIGYKNQLLCKLSSDLQYFKQKTEGKLCVFGRKTIESIGGSLPNRTNIILTRDRNYKVVGCHTYTSVETILHQYKQYNKEETELMICGGETLYNQFLPHANRLYITRIHAIFPKADTYFPKWNIDEFRLVDVKFNKADEKNEFDYTFETWERC